MSAEIVDNYAAKFFQKEVSADSYAYPGTNNACDWKTVFEMALESLESYDEVTFKQMAEAIIGEFTSSCKSASSLNRRLNVLKPYLELCAYLENEFTIIC